VVFNIAGKPLRDLTVCVDYEERRGVGDGGGVDACALLQVQAADMSVAGAVGEGEKSHAGGIIGCQWVGGASRSWGRPI
jgi:hypothetical protein